MAVYDEHPGIVTSDDTTLVQTAFNEMMAVEMMVREKETYAAWRAGYDFLYVLSEFDMMDITLEFIPSNDPERRFEGQRVERYDLREESLPPEALEILERFKP
jgi:hypothetical protein